VTKSELIKPACLVTGCAGFVGSHLTEALLREGHEVVGIDNFFSGRRENMAGFIKDPRFSFYENSISEHGLLGHIYERHRNLQYAFHLAAIVSVPYSMEYPVETMEINHEAAIRLLREAENLGLQRFVFAGSAAEYGNEERLPIREEYADDDTVQLSPYGRAKYLSSRQVAESPIGTALRFFNIYGPRQDPKSQYSGVISRFLFSAERGDPMTIYGSGKQFRDFIFVYDVVNSYLAAAGIGSYSPMPPPGCYNIGSGAATAIIDLAGTICRVMGRHLRIMFEPPREGDIKFSLAAIEKFTAVSAWRPAVALPDGLQRTWHSAFSQKV
jgi:UDP-glucose 4-epimerase